MAEAATSADVLKSASHTPIAELTPSLPNHATKAIKAVITLTWPYSSVTDTVAFLLSEPDFRLRRSRGQVRVQFSGSSAKAIKESGIASGDEVILSLDGVEWIQNGATLATPGRGVEFELKFAERLLLQFKQEDSEEVRKVNVDHPEPSVETPLPLINSEVEVQTVTSTKIPQKRPLQDSISKTVDEYSSPAFLKRARTSYGSLFDSDYDPFEEDDTKQGMGRKRTRLSSTWRYTSRSPTPEAETIVVDAPNSESDHQVREAPTMMDEGCQTIGLEEGNAAETLADFARQANNVDGHSYPIVNGITIREEPQSQSGLNIHLHFPNQDIHQQQAESTLLSTKQPIRPDSLPLISPLVTPEHKFLPNNPDHLETRTRGDEHYSSVDEQISVPIGTGSRMEEDEEDIYNASPPGHRISDTLFTPVNSLHTEDRLYIQPKVPPNPLFRDEEKSAMNGRPGSSFREAEVVEPPSNPNNFYEDNQEQHEPDSVIPSISLDPLGVSQYPDPDDGLHDRPTSTWGGMPSSVTYPSLPALSKYEEEEIQLAPQHPQPTAMSRSQSARSTAIDLTESDEEEIENERFMDENEYGDIEVRDRQRYPIISTHQNSQLHQEEFVEDEEESEESEEEEGYDDQSQRYVEVEENEEDEGKHYSRYAQDNSDGEEDEYSDEEDEEHHQSSFRQRLQRRYSDEEDEAESYEEEEMENDVRPVKQDSVVINLLSSDEEEEEEEEEENTPLPRPSIPTQHPAIQQPHQSPSTDGSREDESEEGEESDADEGMEIEQNVLPARQLHAVPSERQLNHQSGDEDEDAMYEDDDQIDTGEDEEYDKVESDQPVMNQAREMSVEEKIIQEDERESIKPESPQFDHSNNEEGDDEKDTEVNPLIDRPLSQLSKPPPERPSLFSRVFNLDGANDDHLEVSYPTLPRRDSPSPPPASIEEVDTQSVEEQSFKSNQGQLPTPDATQLSPKLISAEISFSEINVVPLDDRSEKVEQEQPGSTEDHQANDTEAIEVIVNLPESEQPITSSTATEQVATDKHKDSETVTYPVKNLEDNTVSVGAEDSSLDDINASAELDTIEVTVDTADISIEEQTIEVTREDEFINNLVEELVAQHNVVEGAITRSKAKQQNDHVDLTSIKEPEYTIDAPRRSHRRAKSTTSTVHTEEEARSTAPTQPELARGQATLEKDHGSPMVVINSQTTPKGHDASIELALSSLDSPSKSQHDLRNPPIVDLKLKLSRALRTELSDFTSLKVLRYHINQKLDVLAVATTTPPEPQRAKNGPRHYQITFNITDPSIAPSGVSEVQIFRPYKEALPAVHAGDGILLRNFQVISVKGRGFALRSSLDEGSSWAVFRDGEADQVRGPPVEYGVGEKNHIVALIAWYGTLDSVARAKITRANGDKQK